MNRSFLAAIAVIAGCGGSTAGGTPNDDSGNDAGSDASSGGSGGGGTGSAATGGAGGSPTGGTGGSVDRDADVPSPFWPDLPLSEFSQPMCSDGGTYQATAGLNPAQPVDYVALRLIDYFGIPIVTDAGIIAGPGGMFQNLSTTGTACATATDVTTCQTALTSMDDAVPLGESCGGPPYPCQHYLVTTAGNDVRRWVGDAEIVQFLGAIDTPQEALLLVYQGTFGGYGVTCGSPDLSSARPVADGYEVVVTQLTRDCAPIEIDRVLLHVATNGTVTELRRNIVSLDDACI